MKQSELFRRYIWLVDLIYRNDGITRDEINRCWSQLEKARAFDPFGHAGLTLLGKIRLTP